MRIVFFGTPNFAARILKSMIRDKSDIVAVVTQPDRPKGRSGTPVPPPVKAVVQELIPSVPVHQPVKASAPEFAEILSSYEADLFVVVAYGEIIRDNLLNMPKKGCINVHPSLLPKYRGAAPIQHALINGETETGVSIMYLVRKMDAGPIIRQEEMEVGPNVTAVELEEQLGALSEQMMTHVLGDFEKGCPDGIEQDEGEVTFASKLLPEDGKVDWAQSAQIIHNQVRGMTPRPGAWCTVTVHGKQKRLKILETELLSAQVSDPGKITAYGDEGIVVGCGEGFLRVLHLQLEGKRAMVARDFCKGISEAELKVLTV